jgi:RNA polymerase sigma factor (sigma-70 family)
MKLFGKRSRNPGSSDADLVMASLAGDRDAFGTIVLRYQGLLCSLAYSSVGDLSQSEDIAQEAFVEAWKRLDTLREPARLKSWLCGILRFKVSRFRRKEARQPVKNAEELDERQGHGEERARTEDMAIRDEEQALLWQAIRRVPENYREPLILYYREDQSIRSVAASLDLSEEAVKQRLSRGRKLLQAEMMEYVEDALSRSKPGASFAAGVLVAISAIPAPAKAATLGTAAVKAGSWFKWANILTFLAAFSGAISTFFGLRASLDQSRTSRERHRAFRTVAILFFSPLVYVAIVFGMRQLALGASAHVTNLAIASQVVALGFVALYPILVVRTLKGLGTLRAQERVLRPEAFQDPADLVDSAAREYKSRYGLAGVPLVHFRFGMPEQDEPPVFGWVAGGDRAYGLLFAWGGIAIAPISVGIVSVGLLSVGTVGLGLLGLGAVGIGVIGFGAAAIAWKAYASLSALGWHSAFSNGFAIARDGAIGPLAMANQVNNDQAAEIVNMVALDHSYLWVLGAIAVLVIVPAVWHSQQVRQRMGRRTRGN